MRLTYIRPSINKSSNEPNKLRPKTIKKKEKEEKIWGKDIQTNAKFRKKRTEKLQ